MSVCPKTVLITGCSRGVGFGLVKEYLKREFQVIATCRNPKTALELSSVLGEHKQHPAIRLVNQKCISDKMIIYHVRFAT